MKLILTLAFVFNFTVEAQMSSLKECPDSPNCVFTQSEQTEKKMDPLPFTGSATDMAEHIKKVVLAMPRTELKKHEGNYLHFTFKSRIFGFVDDVEFEIDESAGLVNFRSASRTGYSDMGANRKRMDAVSKKLMQR